MWGVKMKKSVSIIVLIVTTVLFVFLPILLKNEKILDVFSAKSSHTVNTVILDAGHGGEDGGAVAKDGTLEKDINLDITLKLEKILKFYGFKVIMTRTTDTMTCDENLNTQRQKKISDIKNRFEIISTNEDAIFVSIHQNKFNDSSQKGTQVFYSKNNSESKILADSIQKSIVNFSQPQNKRIIKKSGTDIYLLYHAQIPAVMVECGFISNNEDLNNLKNDEYKSKMALLIADGILKYSLNG